MSRSRCFFFTANKDLEEAFNYLKLQDTRYTLIGPIERAPTTGHEHFHACIYYKSPHSVRAIINGFNRFGMVEVGRGNAEQIRQYCCKTGKPLYEFGEVPQQGKRTDLITAIEEAKTLSEFKMNNPDLFCRYHNGIKEYYEEAHAEKLLDKAINEVLDGTEPDLEVIYITGPSGSGKSHFSIEYAVKGLGFKPSEIGFVECSGDFNIGSRLDAKCLILNEFRDSQMPLRNFLNLTDRYTTTFNIKGSKLVVKPKAIIINSIKPLTEIYKASGESRKQIYRRITKLFYMNGPGKEPDVDYPQDWAESPGSFSDSEF